MRGKLYTMLQKLDWCKYFTILTVLFFAFPSPFAFAEAEIIDVRIAASHKALANDRGEAKRRYLDLLQKYNSLSQDQKWSVDFLGAKIRYLEGSTLQSIAALEDLTKLPLSNTLAIEVYTYLAGAKGLSNQFDQAFESLNKAVSLISATTSKAVEMETLVRAASMYEQAGSFNETLQYAERLEALASPTSNYRFLCRAQYLKGKGKSGVKKLSDADIHFQQALTSCAKAKEENFVKLVKQDIAQNWLEQGRSDEALQLLTQLYEAVTPETYWAIGVADVQFLLARAYWQKENWQKAIEIGSEALEYAREIQYPFAIREASHILGMSYAELGQYRQAYENHLTQMDAAKLVTSEAQARSLAYQRAKYDSRDQARQIQQLENQNRLLELEQALQYSERRTIIFISVLGVIFLLFIILRFRNQRTQFQKLSQTDGLTGISNRHHAMMAGEKLIKVCERGGKAIGVILFDLDNFKRVNDDFGHAAGDWVLQQAATECKARLRKGDLFGRYGGEEFLVILPDVTLEVLKQKAEIIRGAIEKVDTSATGSIFPISASFGVTHAHNRAEPPSLSTLINEADRALYRAKSDGRNRIEVH